MTRERTIRRSTVLDAAPDLVWAAVCTPQAFRFVTRGLIGWRPVRHRDEPWHEGDEAVGWLLLGGVLPFSRHRIRIVELDGRRRVLRSDESGGVVRSWRHDIVVEALDGGRCRYTDVVHIDAGAFTPLVVMFGKWLYLVRQRRWRVLAQLLAGAESTRHRGALDQLRRHEAAFNTGDVSGLMADYTDDVVLEAHLAGQRLDMVGEQVRSALQQATSAGTRTRVRRVAASAEVVAAQIDDDNGSPYMVSFWELRDGRIARDVSIVLAGGDAG